MVRTWKIYQTTLLTPYLVYLFISYSFFIIISYKLHWEGELTALLLLYKTLLEYHIYKYKETNLFPTKIRNNEKTENN